MTDSAPHGGPVVSGVQALARLLLLRSEVDERSGLRTATMVSGYPGSPLGTFDLVLNQTAAQLQARRVVHQPGLNEELAAATVWGSQMGAAVPYADGVDGVAGVWYGKTPGLDRSGDVLKHGNAMGAGPNGGVVLLCGDDPGAKSSTLNCDSQYTFQDACIPVLYPGSQQDLLDLGMHAFFLSRYSGAWVGLKVVTAVADGLGPIDPRPDRYGWAVPDGFTLEGRPWQHRPLATIGPHQIPDQELLVIDHRLRAAQAYAEANGLNAVVGAPGVAQVGIVCAGKTYFDVLQAFDDLGVSDRELVDLGVRVLKLGMTYPLAERSVVEFAHSVREIVVIEEKRPFVETQLRSILHEVGSPVPVVGKRDKAGEALVPSVGELGPGAVADALARVVPVLAVTERRSGRRAGSVPVPLTLPGRAPGFCSGCPHNRSTVAPAGALVGGGVGCHGIMYFEARQSATKKLAPTPMGAEGVPWVGLAPFAAEPHLVQNLGDGTLSHSGTLAIRSCVAAGVNITFKILYNSAVAMTGGQDVTGLMDVPSLTRALEAEGVCKIVVCSEQPRRFGRRARWAPGVEVLGRDRLPEAQERLRGVDGVTVIVYDQRCAAEARRLRKRGLLPEPPRRVVVNEAVCEGCGDCSTKSNCLSVLPVQTEFGEKRQVHDPSCNRDYTCLEGDCPSFVTITPRRAARRRAVRPPEPAARPALPSGALPVPEIPRIDGSWGVYFTGIGGTGVVTANRVLAGWAEASGLFSNGLDQTGLSQKAGAVVSHLHVAADPHQLRSAAVGPGAADLYLSGDILQAANASHLAVARTGHTLAVVDPDLTRTAAMLQSDADGPDPAQLRGVIVDALGRSRVHFVESRRIAESVFADHMLANVVLLGAAFQSGGLPLPPESFDAALGSDPGAARNRAAFAWGRWAVHDPAATEEAIALAGAGAGAGRPGLWDPSNDALRRAERLVGAADVPADLRELLTRRAAQVVDYQNAARGARFLGLVERAAACDRAEDGWALTRAVAASWFKLLTYKDEYEVARLHLKADHAATARQLGIDGPYAVRYHLHPPTLRRLGLRRKLAMGAPYEWSFRALRRMRRLRGTPFDPFGWDRDRRNERALIDEYEAMLRRVLEPGSDLPYDAAVRVAGSAEQIKGYGEIKERAAVRWRAQVADALAPESATAESTG